MRQLQTWLLGLFSRQLSGMQTCVQFLPFSIQLHLISIFLFHYLACSCNTLGTIGNMGCHVVTGECVCKRHVVGRDCDKCEDNYYDMSEEEEGCKPCDCDLGGSYKSQCDITTGECDCRPNLEGRKCSELKSGYFAPLLDFQTYEGENASHSTDVQPQIREPYSGRESLWTGPGYVRVFEKSTLDFDIDDIPSTSNYDILLRYEPLGHSRWDKARLKVEKIEGTPEKNASCKSDPESHRSIYFHPEGRYSLAEGGPVCFEKGSKYKVNLEMGAKTHGPETSSILIDSMVLMPNLENHPLFQGPGGDYRKQEFQRYRCAEMLFNSEKTRLPKVCEPYYYSLSYIQYDGGQTCDCDPTGSESLMCNPLGGQCKCKPNVMGRTCDRCAPGYYGFGPEGCKPCDCHSFGSLDNFCDSVSGSCKCRNNTYGRQCNECQPGYWDYPNCKRCDCNGHAELCESQTGACLNCSDNTAGHRCDRCAQGYFGNPIIGVNVPCRLCPCPGTINSGNHHAEDCDLDLKTGNPICRCKKGYSGDLCDRCSDNYWGEPDKLDGQCLPCECNNNIDINQTGNCDSKSGVCLKCLYNTDGPGCEKCKDGFYGDALSQHCNECICNLLGTDSSAGACDPVKGQCPCLPNVVGVHCNKCEVNHWNLSSGKGCEPCECDPQGSYSLKCNEYDGQCACKDGHGGKRCNECQPNYWGDPRIQCFRKLFKLISENFSK